MEIHNSDAQMLSAGIRLHQTAYAYALYVCNTPGQTQGYRALLRSDSIDNEPEPLVIARRGALVTYDELVQYPCLVRLLRNYNPASLLGEYMSKMIMNNQAVALEFVMSDKPLEFDNGLKYLLDCAMEYAPYWIPMLLTYGAKPLTESVIVCMNLALENAIKLNDLRFIDPVMLLRKGVDTGPGIVTHLRDTGRILASMNPTINSNVEMLGNMREKLKGEYTNPLVMGMTSYWRTSTIWMDSRIAKFLQCDESQLTELEYITDMCTDSNVHVALVKYCIAQHNIAGLLSMLRIDDFKEVLNLKCNWMQCDDFDIGWLLLNNGIRLKNANQLLIDAAALPTDSMRAAAIPNVLRNIMQSAEKFKPTIHAKDEHTLLNNAITTIIAKHATLLDQADMVKCLMGGDSRYVNSCVDAMQGHSHLAAAAFVLAFSGPQWINTCYAYCAHGSMGDSLQRTDAVIYAMSKLPYKFWWKWHRSDKRLASLIVTRVIRESLCDLVRLLMLPMDNTQHPWLSVDWNITEPMCVIMPCIVAAQHRFSHYESRAIGQQLGELSHQDSRGNHTVWNAFMLGVLNSLIQQSLSVSTETSTLLYGIFDTILLRPDDIQQFVSDRVCCTIMLELSSNVQWLQPLLTQAPIDGKAFELLILNDVKLDKLYTDAIDRRDVDRLIKCLRYSAPLPNPVQARSILAMMPNTVRIDWLVPLMKLLSESNLLEWVHN
jgi:hypothetical protein